MKRFIIFISIILLLVSCDTNEQVFTDTDENMVYFEEAVAPKRAMSAGALMQESNEDQKIIRTANLRYEVNEMDSSLKTLEKILSEYKGEIQSERQYSQADRLYIYLTVRIPADKFETFITALLAGDEIRRLEEKNISARDVTEQFIDIESRLSTKRQALTRYRELLQKAETVTDMITVEDKIRRLQEEIESQEARLKYLSGQVEMSEVRITMYESVSSFYVPDKSNAFGPQFLRSLNNGWKGVVDIFFWLIGFWPIWSLIIVIIIITTSKKRNKE
ncbi:MAG: DUF4349 domain-containing protein [Candidatus Marinimicrobia bacterium]|nr:DUF4349 domain-containing protein [Candidatus Neomarinimicrobiota bacterium]